MHSKIFQEKKNPYILPLSRWCDSKNWIARLMEPVFFSFYGKQLKTTRSLFCFHLHFYTFVLFLSQSMLLHMLRNVPNAAQLPGQISSDAVKVITF